MPETAHPYEMAHLTSEAAQRYADLLLVRADLERVIEWAGLVAEQPDPVKSALFDAAVIRYRRCMKSGRRFRLDLVTNSWCASQAAAHERLITVADKHVAHSVNNLEAGFTCAMVDDQGEFHPTCPVVAYSYQILNFDDAMIQELLTLARALKASVYELLEHTQESIIHELRMGDKAELLLLRGGPPKTRTQRASWLGWDQPNRAPLALETRADLARETIFKAAPVKPKPER